MEIKELEKEIDDLEKAQAELAKKAEKLQIAKLAEMEREYQEKQKEEEEKEKKAAAKKKKPEPTEQPKPAVEDRQKIGDNVYILPSNEQREAVLNIQHTLDEDTARTLNSLRLPLMAIAVSIALGYILALVAVGYIALNTDAITGWVKDIILYAVQLNGT